MKFAIPSEVEAIFHQFRTAELSTISKDDIPLAWPVTVAYRPESGTFVLGTSIGLPQKAFNIRRNAKVSLLFSEGKASGLHGLPAVIVQGDAVAPDELTSMRGLEDVWEKIVRFQPGFKVLSSTVFGRWIFDWYYTRLIITIAPCRIAWWPLGDFHNAPQEVIYVG